MNPAIVPPNEMVRPRIATIPRLLAMASYSLGALGASLSAFLLCGVLEAMRAAENAGISAVTGGLAESNIPVLVGLYAAIAGGFITIIVAAVRTGIATNTVSPPAFTPCSRTPDAHVVALARNGNGITGIKSN